MSDTTDPQIPEPGTPRKRTLRNKVLVPALLAGALTATAAVGLNLAGSSAAAEGPTTTAATATSAPSAGAQDEKSTRPPVVGGTVTKVSGDTFVVEGHARTGTPAEGRSQGANSKTDYTVKTDDETTFIEHTEGSVSDLKKGDEIVVGGDADGDVLSARHIAQIDPDRPGPEDGGAKRDCNKSGDRPEASGRHGRASGTITSISGSKLTVKTRAGETLQVTTNQDTKVRVAKDVSAADVQVGDRVRATGTLTGTTMTADTVRIGAMGTGRPGPGGPGGPSGENPGGPPPSDAPQSPPTTS